MSRVIRLLCDCNDFFKPLAAGAILIEGTHLASHGIDKLLQSRQAELYVEPDPEPVVAPEPEPQPEPDLPEPTPPVGRTKRKKR